MIKLCMTALLMTLCLSSCNSIKPQVNCDLNFQFDRCRCRCYDLNNATTLPAEKCNNPIKSIYVEKPFYVNTGNENKDIIFIPGNYELRVCDKMTGFFIEPFAKYIKPKIKEKIQYCRDIKDDQDY